MRGSDKVTHAMPPPDGPPHPQDARLSLSMRLRLIGQGVRSSARRYPRDLAQSLLRRAEPEAEPAQGHAEFRDRWERLWSHAGLCGVAWLGQCSVLIRLGGVTILTDPVLSSRIGPRIGGRVVGPSRLTPAPLLARQLPRIDLILVSHAHYDHLDRPTLRALARPHTQVITAQHTRALIPRGFQHRTELGWGQVLHAQGITIRALRPRHWGARTGWDRHRGYNSYLISDGRSSVLFAGDTADTRAFKGLGPVDLAIFGVGAYTPWEHAHATPEQVWTMAQDAQARRLLPVHYATFTQSDEPPGEPLERLRAAAGDHQNALLIAEQGQVMPLP
jgi:L-ascorbate metabolism protein UlaG (beta-lactamase superfamily)